MNRQCPEGELELLGTKVGPGGSNNSQWLCPIQLHSDLSDITDNMGWPERHLCEENDLWGH